MSVRRMTIGSLFSGIGGLELGLEWAGLGPTLWQVEQDPFCRKVLKERWPDVERFEDVRSVGTRDLAPVWLICGGFPCQDVSAAGKGAGLDGARSGLWWEFARIVGELRPPWVVVENVASGAKRWVDAVRGSLGQLGYETLPVPIAASDVGAPHLRRRIFVVAAHTERGSLRDLGQRVPARRADGVRPQGLSQLAHDGEEGAAADANGRRRKGGGLSSVRGLGSPSRGEPDGRGDTWPVCSRGDARPTRGPAWTPEPPVRGVDAGLSSRLDRDRLKALGNTVVPQCAEVVGWVIRMLIEQGVDSP